MARTDAPNRRRDWNVWTWVERVAMVSAIGFTTAGVGAIAWLFSVDGDPAAPTAEAELGRFETAAGAPAAGPVAVVPPAMLAGAKRVAAVAALTPRESAPAPARPDAAESTAPRPVPRPSAVASRPAAPLHVTRQALNIRLRPASGAPILGVLPIDSEVEETGRSGGWMQVRTAGADGDPVQGWVDARFLRRVR